MLSLYNKVLLPARALLPLWAAWRGRGAAQLEWDQRRARQLPEAPGDGIWLHGASVGEARIVSEVARELRDRDPTRGVAVSAMTPAGRALLPSPPDVDAAFFAPLDIPGFPSRVLATLKPACLALVETELWPNMIHETHKAGVPLVMVNGRLSPRRMSRYSRFRGLYTPLLNAMERIGAQSPADAKRFEQLGVASERITITGNIKYDLSIPPGDPAALLARLGLEPSRPIVVAGSTRQGEEAPVLDAFQHARQHCPELFLVLAPRRIARTASLVDDVRERGLDAGRLSEVDQGARPPRDVLLIDSLGELQQLYKIGSVAFVGGTLAPIGGHNVLEPAAVGIPVLFGPHTQHVEEPARALLDHGAAWRVEDAAGLGERLAALLTDDAARGSAGRCALEVLDLHRGALAASVELIEAALAKAPAGRRGTA